VGIGIAELPTNGARIPIELERAGFHAALDLI
jgi:hypothetical protein